MATSTSSSSGCGRARSWSSNAGSMCRSRAHIEPALLDKMLDSLRSACEANDPQTMLRQLRNLVPEYRPAHEVNAEVSKSLAER